MYLAQAEINKKVGVKKGCITGEDSPKLARFLEILEWFDAWRRELKLFRPMGVDLDNFVMGESWFDMQLTILGFVSLSHYVFRDEPLINESGRRSCLFPRDFSQASTLVSGW